MAGELSFFEVGVGDVAKAQAFYGDLFGWTFELVSDGYVISGTGTGGGLTGATKAPAPTSSSRSTR